MGNHKIPKCATSGKLYNGGKRGPAGNEKNGELRDRGWSSVLPYRGLEYARTLNPCARESKAAQTGTFLREKLMSDHGLFSSYQGHKERRTGKIRGAFSGMHRTLDG